MSTISENNDYTKFVTRSDEMTSFRSDSSVHVGKGAFKGLKNLEAIVLSEDDEGKDVSNRLEAKSIEPNTKFLFLKNYTNTSQTFDMTYGNLPLDISGKISVRYVSYSDSSKTEPDISYETCNVSVTGHKAVQKDFEDYSDDEMLSLASTSYPEVAKMYVGYEFVDNTCAEANMPCYHNSLQLNICMYGLNTDDPEKLGRMSFKIHSIDGYLVGKPSVTLNGVYSLGKLYGKYNTYVRFEGLTISATEYLSRTVSEISNLPEADAVQSSDTAVLFKKKKSLQTDVHDGFIGIKPYCTLNKINGYADGKAVEGGGFMQQYCHQAAFLRWNSDTSYAGISSIGMNSSSASAWFFTYICDEDGNEQTDENTGWFEKNGTTDNAFRCFQTVANSAVVSSFRLGSPYVVSGHYNTAMFIPYASSMHFSGSALNARIANLSSLAEVYLPCQSVAMTFPNEAFAYAYGLTSFTFGCGNAGSRINSYAFRNCSALDNVSLSGVSLVSSNAFYNCTNLKSLSLTNVTSVCANAFLNCSSLKSVSFDGCGAISPSAAFTASVLSGIEDVAFSNMDEVPASAFSFRIDTTDTVSSNPNSIKHISIRNCSKIGDCAFSYCSSVSTIDCIFADIIGNGAFYQLNSLTDVTVNSALTACSAAFLGCGKLTSIDLEQIRELGKGALQGCLKLRRLYLPNCTSIGMNAFYNCKALTSVYAPQLTQIPYGAFMQCTALPQLSDNIALASIGERAFSKCYSLSSINIANVASVPACAFSNCYSLSSINASAATSVDAYAFAYCSSLTSIDISKASSIGQRAFLNDFALATVTLDSPTSIGGAAFSDCHSITSDIYFGSTEANQSHEGKNSVIMDIGSHAFSECSSITAIYGTIASYTSFGSSVFRGMSNLRYIPQLFNDSDLGMRNIPQYTFAYCSSLGNPNPDEDEDGYFEICNISSIQPYAFSRCIGIKTLYINNCEITEWTSDYSDWKDIPVSSLTIYGNAFANCSGISEIRINDLEYLESSGTISISNSAFVGCDKMVFGFPVPFQPDVYGKFKGLSGAMWLMHCSSISKTALTSTTAKYWGGVLSSSWNPLYILDYPVLDQSTDYWSLTGYTYGSSSPVVLTQRAHSYTGTASGGTYYFDMNGIVEKADDSSPTLEEYTVFDSVVRYDGKTITDLIWVYESGGEMKADYK